MSRESTVRIPGSCPECGAIRWAEVTELAREHACTGCGTRFVYIRERRRRRVPRTPRPAEIERAQSGVPRPDRKALRRIVILLAALLGLGALAVIASLNLDRVVPPVRDAWERLAPVPVEPEAAPK